MFVVVVVFTPYNRIICSLQTPLDVALSEVVNVTVDGDSTNNNDTFRTLTPVITSVYPGYAPQYGGSVINVTGTNLGVGSSRTLTAGIECNITSQTGLCRDETIESCLTNSYR